VADHFRRGYGSQGEDVLPPRMVGDGARDGVHDDADGGAGAGEGAAGHAVDCLSQRGHRPVLNEVQVQPPGMAEVDYGAVERASREDNSDHGGALVGLFWVQGHAAHCPQSRKGGDQEAGKLGQAIWVVH